MHANRLEHANVLELPLIAETVDRRYFTSTTATLFTPLHAR